MKKQVKLQISLLVIMLLACICFLNGCSNQVNQYVKKGKQHLLNGDKRAALREFKKAFKIEPGNAKAKTFIINLEKEIAAEDKKSFFHLELLVITISSFPLLLYAFFSLYPTGPDYLEKVKILFDLYNWNQLEEVHLDFVATISLLKRKHIYSYISPLSKIIKELFMLRDAYLSGLERSKELDRMLNTDISTLEALSWKIKDKKNGEDTRQNIASYRQKVKEQKQAIEKFAETFMDSKIQVKGFLIDLRTKLDLDETFDRESEFDFLAKQISLIRKTFQAAENKASNSF